MTKPGPERNQPVNCFRSDGERFRELVTEIQGCGRNLEGSFLSLVGLSWNRERRGFLRNRRKPLPQLAINAKRPAAELSAPGVNCVVAIVRRRTKSSSGRTRTYDPAVNSRLLYQLSYRGMCWNVRKSNGRNSGNQDTFALFQVRPILPSGDKTLSPHAPEHRFRRDASFRT